MKKTLTILAVTVMGLSLTAFAQAEITSWTVSEQVIEGPAVLNSVVTEYHSPVVVYPSPYVYRTASYYRPGYTVSTYGPVYRNAYYHYPRRIVVF